MLEVLLHTGSDDVGFDSDLVFKYYGDPDEWDATMALVRDKKGRTKWVEYKGTMFPFIKLERLL